MSAWWIVQFFCLGTAVLAMPACGEPAATDDLDGDGFNLELDCDDEDPAAHPGAAEVCNELDDDCDGRADEDLPGLYPIYLDADRDGFGGTFFGYACAEGWGAPEFSGKGGDCDDTDAAVNPARLEACGTTYDDNCDGLANDACEEG